MQSHGKEYANLESRDFYYQHIWNDAFESCRATLGDDFDVVSECESCEKLVEHLKELCEDYKNTETAKILKSLRHNLAPFQKLTHACAFAMRGYFVRTGIIWGLVNFLIEVSDSLLPGATHRHSS
jgi:hypothetical protein